jgi:hypothetical protein
LAVLLSLVLFFAFCSLSLLFSGCGLPCTMITCFESLRFVLFSRGVQTPHVSRSHYV